MTTETTRTQVAEQEVQKLKEQQVSQDGQTKAYVARIAALEQQMEIPHDAKLMNAENICLMSDRVRSCAILSETVNRHYDHESRQVLSRLLNANEQIVAMKLVLKKRQTKVTRESLLEMLKDADVNKDSYTNLNEQNRQVLVKQCRAVNIRLAELRGAIKGMAEPDKAAILEVMYKNRGDELAHWHEVASASEPSSDEDEDDNNQSSSAQTSGPRPMRFPASRRPVQARSTQLQQPPSSMEEVFRPHPLFTRRPRQAQSSPEATAHPTETRRESQHGSSSQPERIGEASSFQQQSTDRPDMSLQLPSTSSSPSQQTPNLATP